MLESMLEDHRHIARMADRLERIVASDAASDLAMLSPIRWTFAREVLQHVIVENRLIRTAMDRSGVLPKLSPCASAWLRPEGFETPFRDYAARWDADALQADWQGYRRATMAILGALHRRVELEEREIYPMLMDGAATATIAA